MAKKVASSIVLDALDQERAIEQEEYRARLKDCQLRLLNMQRRMAETNRSLIVVVEGPDAAGKGGAIRRLVEKLDPRTVRVWSTIKPTAEELAHHYLWRFWTRLPTRGQLTVFDRSWYGRVLVERVEGFATPEEWGRAYDEINAFERLLADDGAVFVKLYLHISKDEQLARFKRRASDPYKHWKINEEDWRNRRKWQQHNDAAQAMFARTSTDVAPWKVIPSNYKWYARVGDQHVDGEGMTKRVKKVPTAMPPTSTRPMELRAAAPAPVTSTAGSGRRWWPRWS
jgi:polyphosphate kinase 2 (PPK2 family)